MKEVKKLIDLGKEKGYLTYDDVNDMLPAEVVSPDQIDDVMSIFGEMDIEVVDANQRVTLGGAGEEIAEEEEEEKEADGDVDGDYVMNVPNFGTMLCEPWRANWSGGIAGGVDHIAYSRNIADADGSLCDGAKYFDALCFAGAGGSAGVFAAGERRAGKAMAVIGVLWHRNDAGGCDASLDGCLWSGLRTGAELHPVSDLADTSLGNGRTMSRSSG